MAIDQNPPAGAVRYEWLGRNLGSILRTNPATGTSYRVGFNMEDRFLWVAPTDLAWVQAQPEAFAPAPLDEPPADILLSDQPPTKPSKKAKAITSDTSAPSDVPPTSETA